MPYAGLLLLASGLSFFIFMQAYVATYLLAARLVISRWGSKRPLTISDRGTIVLVLGVVVLSGVFSLVCCENGRWFLQCTPYLLPLLTCFLQEVLLRGSA